MYWTAHLKPICRLSDTWCKWGAGCTGVEASNEIYSKYSSLTGMPEIFQPGLICWTVSFPDISKGLVAGANVQRKQLQQWNDALAAYQNDYDAVLMHYYYTARNWVLL